MDSRKNSKKNSINTRKESVIFFDIDDTLILWGKNKTDVSFIEPHSGCIESGIANKEHVQRLKDHYNAGHFIIAWSGGGAEYCKRAIEALGLTKYTHLSISKPMQYYDDLPAEEWMGRRSYIGETGIRAGQTMMARSEMIIDYEDKDEG